MLAQFKHNWRKLLPGLVISLASIIVILWLIDFDRFIEAIKLADYRFIFLLFAITLFWLFIRAIVWRTLLSEQATLYQTFMALNEGYLLNNVLPFRLGEIGRALLLSRNAGMGFWQVFSTVIIERLLDVGFAAGLLLVSVTAVVQTGFASQTAITAGAVFFAALIGLYLIVRNQERVTLLVDRLRSKNPFINALIKKNQLEAFFSGLSILTDNQRFLRVTLWMTVNWGIAVLQFYILLKAFFPDPQLIWAPFSLGVMALGIAAPSSPGAIGVMEISIVGALSVFNQDPSTSLAAALTAHASNYLITGFIGAYALAQDGLTITSLYQNARQISTDQKDLAD